MKNLIVNKLYIFSNSDRKAKAIDFSRGKNIVTSSKIDGNKKGKSIVMKSIYHALGADCFFDDKWDSENKIYILNFTVKEKTYFIYRYDRLFKIYTNSFEHIFMTIDRMELAEFLKSVFEFAVELPNRADDKLEITPPAYNYLLNFIDQDKMDGTKFGSFNNLAQYADYKENVLYYHFGALDQDYYEIIKKMDRLNGQKEMASKEAVTVEKMLIKIKERLGGLDYSKDIESLTDEIEESKTEFMDITIKLSKIKKSLIKMRNDKEEILYNMGELEFARIALETDVDKANQYICPLCESHVENTMEIRISKYNTLEDLSILRTDLDVDILRIDKKIKTEEEKYAQILKLLNDYEKRLNQNSSEVNSVIKYKGLIEVQHGFYNELGELRNNIQKIMDELTDYAKKKKEYDDIKKAINKKYCELMIADKQRFDLKEIDSKRFDNIRLNFGAGGSNKPLITVVWYFNLLRVKYLFNPNSIIFPLVLDSPNNVELDDEKRFELFNYLFNNNNSEAQLIISTLGFKKESYPDTVFENIIELTNEKYQLLNENDYNKNKWILNKFNERKRTS